jgi:DsbC/DsbD-like thiol-disulfide interchange protein
VSRRRVVSAALALMLTGASALLAAQAAATRETKHLKFTVSVAPRVVSTGDRLTLTVDVSPKARMHVYAPGSKYRPIKVTIEPQPALTIEQTAYPRAESYYFKPLKETQPVYQTPFRLQVGVTVVAIEPASARTDSTITIAGALDYQACDDRVCYLPESIPLRWTMKVNAPHSASFESDVPSAGSGARPSRADREARRDRFATAAPGRPDGPGDSR